MFFHFTGCMVALALLAAAGGRPDLTETSSNAFPDLSLTDTVAPTVLCVDGFYANLLPTSLLTVWAADLVDSAGDDQTSPNDLQFAVRKAGQGTGFPLDAAGQPQLSVTFNCCQLGFQNLELWVRDAAGNTAFCETFVAVQDPFNNCSFCPLSVGVCLPWSCDPAVGVAGARIDLLVDVYNGIPPALIYTYSGVSGCRDFLYAVPLGSDITLQASSNDDPRNGLSTLDLVLISKHILGIEPLDSPYKIIAADANRSNSVTTFDILELRKLLLGVYDSLPNNTSWRFVDKNFVFPDPANPFDSLPLPETITVSSVVSDQFNHALIGIKVGDVNCTASPDTAALRKPATRL